MNMSNDAAKAELARAKLRMTTMIAALRSARRLLLSERNIQFDGFTIPPDRSYDQMEPEERAAIARFDRTIDKINKALFVPVPGQKAPWLRRG